MGYGDGLLERALCEALNGAERDLVRRHCERNALFRSQLIALLAHLQANLAPHMLVALARQLGEPEPICPGEALDRALAQVVGLPILELGELTEGPEGERRS